MHPTQVIDCHVDLVTRLGGNSSLSKVIEGTLNSAGMDVKLPNHPNTAAAEMTNLMYWQAKAAYAYRVTKDMCVLLEHAANALDDEDTWAWQNAPTEHGLVLFETPLKLVDIRGETMLVHWLLWGKTTVTGEKEPARAGSALHFFNDIVIEPDETARKVNTPLETQQALVGRWSYIGTEFYPNGAVLGEMGVSPVNRIPDDVLLEYIDEGIDVYEVKVTNVARYIHALWLMLNQTIVSVDEQTIERHARKRAKRAGIPGRVTVITLRRTENYHRADGESLVEWQRRWVVRGHWRWQPYGEGRQQRRRIWIAPTIKGPADKPLIVPDKIYNWSR